ncbi:hypothetical protein ACOSP7_022524 [Xanthoceras sorbifolium]
MEGKYTPKAAWRAAQLTLKCLTSYPKDRPSMKEVMEEQVQIEAMTSMKDVAKVLKQIEEVDSTKEVLEVLDQIKAMEEKQRASNLAFKGLPLLAIAASHAFIIASSIQSRQTFQCTRLK